MFELVTPGSGLSLLKSKTLGKRKLKPAIRFPVDLQKFVNNSMRSVRRLPRRDQQDRHGFTAQRDERMEEEKEAVPPQTPFRRRE